MFIMRNNLLSGSVVWLTDMGQHNMFIATLGYNHNAYGCWAAVISSAILLTFLSLLLHHSIPFSIERANVS